MSVREEQRRETAARVLQTAGELFRARGFESTTVRDIAGACGVSPGTVMSVGDKDALLVASFDRLIAQIHEARSRAAGDPEGSRTDRIIALFEPFLDLFTSDAALARRYGAILVAGEHESIVFTELSEALIREIDTVLSNRVEGDAPDVRALAESIYFAYIGRLFTWSSRVEGDFADPAGLRQSLRRIVAAVCRNEGSER